MDLRNWLGRLPIKNVFVFSGMQVIAAVVPFAVLPVVTRTVGADGWVALALGLGVGGVAALVIAFAWPLRGPGLVARVPDAEASEVYSRSFSLRLFVSIPVLILTVIVTCVLTSESFRLLGVAMALATAINGLTSSWFFVARAKPAYVAITDVGPRVLASIASLPLVLLTGSGLYYPLALGIGVVCGIVLTHRVITGDVKTRPNQFSNIAIDLKRQWHLVASAVVLTGYGAFAVPLSSLAPGSTVAVVAGFAAAVRLRSMVQVGISSVTSAFQGWALAGSIDTSRRRRLIASLSANILVGLVSGLGFALIAPQVASFFFGPAVEITAGTACAVGAACVAYATSSSFSYQILGPAQMTRSITRGTLSGAIVGVPAVILGTTWFGAAGAATGVALAEWTVALVQLPAALRALHALAR